LAHGRLAKKKHLMGVNKHKKKKKCKKQPGHSVNGQKLGGEKGDT